MGTGYDYTSFFSQLGKATFLRYFFQYASFITGGEQPGTLADTQLNERSYKLGFLAFMRLIGTVYFMKHTTGFNTSSPSAHFFQFRTQSTSIEQQHMYGWTTFVKTYGIESSLKMKCCHLLRLCCRNHVG